MSDAEFLQQLENCTLAESDFDHAGHVRAAYLCLRGGEFAEGLVRIRDAIRRYAVHLGKPERYHETITVAFAALVRQHLCERGPGAGWAEFARANPELMRSDLLERFYPKPQLGSALARKTFLLPPGAGTILET